MEYPAEFHTPSTVYQEGCTTSPSPTPMFPKVSNLVTGIWERPSESHDAGCLKDYAVREMRDATQSNAQPTSVPSPRCTSNVNDGFRIPPYDTFLPTCDKERSQISAPTADGVSINALSSLFSSEPILAENTVPSGDWDVFFPLRECWNSSSRPPTPTIPLGVCANITDTPPKLHLSNAIGEVCPQSADMQRPFFSLEEDTESEEVCALPVNFGTTYCSEGNIVEALIAQLAANGDSVVPTSINKVYAPQGQRTSSAMSSFQEGTVRNAKRGAAVSDPLAAHFLDNTTDIYEGVAGRHVAATAVCEGQQRHVPPFAICCSPIDLPGVGNGRAMNERHRGFIQHRQRGADTASRSGKGGLAPGSWHLGRRPLYSLPFPLVDHSMLSDLYRDTPQDQELRRIINSNGPGGPLMSSEWPPRTKSCVVKMLRQLHAKVLLQHLRVVSFARRDLYGVVRLFDSWNGKGIPPPGVMFGSYYFYTMSKFGREMCLKHNGRERAGGFCRGCDYAQRGPNFRCRYQHACLFCLSDDHGWFDETCCQRYVALQQKMVELRITDAVAQALLDALETEDEPIRRKG
ncbi:uncharacterized protein TEOVI_000616600 [Trypanosoma equiperdum]|uniref:Uncharacterized protein n=1 Tax=Trypanosoma equiperdum TaxID=5694 RepID=A0A1G4IA94_TRYEQ|nr:hypothetical protein, conserved [Trypanosoma equiperdum]